MDRNTRFAHPAAVESLESRIHLASYNLMALTGYNRLGASWNYDVSSVVSGTGGTSSTSGTQTIGVKRTTGVYEGHNCNIIKTTGSGITMTNAWYTDSTGTHCMGYVQASSLGTINVRVHNTVIAPKAMTLGQAYSDAGTFDGTFKMSAQGTTIVGTLRGTTTARSQLYKVDPVTVPAGTFNNAIKGMQTLAMTGTMTITYEGATYRAQYSAKVPQTFWAVPNKGIVRSMTTGATINLTIEGETAYAKIVSTARLRSFGVPSTTRVAPIGRVSISSESKTITPFSSRAIVGDSLDRKSDDDWL
jgi:hypothetical protein